MKKFLFIFSFFLASTSPLFAEGLALSSKTEILPSTVVPVAQNAQAAVTIQSSEEIKIASAPLPASEDFQWIKTEIKDAKKSADGKWTTLIAIDFLPLNQGELVFPSLTFSYKGPDGAAQNLQSPPAKLSAVNPLGAQAAPEMLKDVKPPIELFNWVLWLTFALILAACVLLHLYFKRQQPTSDVPVVPAEPPRPLHERILDQLEKLLAEFRAQPDIKVFYIGLSDIFRDYLQGRYGVDTFDKTTSEIFAAMKQADVERKDNLESKEILSQSDLVKFAKFYPDEKEIEADWNKVKDFVLRTKIEPTSKSKREPKATT